MPFLMEQFTGQQQRQADLETTKLQQQTAQFQLQQAQKQSALLDQESAMLREQADITPTLGGMTQDGQVVSPIIQQLKNTAKIQAKLGNVEGYRKSLKDIVDAENKESEILKRNADIQKEQAGYKAGAAQYALDNNDVEGGLAIMAKYDPIGAMRMYAAAPKGPNGKIVLSPEIKQALQRTVAENTTRKEAADIQQKQINEREKEQYRQESLELRRQAQADRRADQAARREERKSIREEKAAKEAKREKKIGKLSDPKEVERTSEELGKDHPKLEGPSRNRAAEDIRTRQKELMRSDEDMSAKEAYDQAYDEISSKIKDDKGYLFGFGSKSTYGKESKPVTTLPSGWTVKEK